METNNPPPIGPQAVTGIIGCFVLLLALVYYLTLQKVPTHYHDTPVDTVRYTQTNNLYA